ncbi:hypothetical protein Ancab_001948 [Ancistrocladus abbreviatus]
MKTWSFRQRIILYVYMSGRIVFSSLIGVITNGGSNCRVSMKFGYSIFMAMTLGSGGNISGKELQPEFFFRLFWFCWGLNKRYILKGRLMGVEWSLNFLMEQQKEQPTPRSIICLGSRWTGVTREMVSRSHTFAGWVWVICSHKLLLNDW